MAPNSTECRPYNEIVSWICQFRSRAVFPTGQFHIKINTNPGANNVDVYMRKKTRVWNLVIERLVKENILEAHPTDETAFRWNSSFLPERVQLPKPSKLVWANRFFNDERYDGIADEKMTEILGFLLPPATPIFERSSLVETPSMVETSSTVAPPLMPAVPAFGTSAPSISALSTHTKLVKKGPQVPNIHTIAILRSLAEAEPQARHMSSKKHNERAGMSSRSHFKVEDSTSQRATSPATTKSRYNTTTTNTSNQPRPDWAGPDNGGPRFTYPASGIFGVNQPSSTNRGHSGGSNNTRNSFAPGFKRSDSVAGSTRARSVSNISQHQSQSPHSGYSLAAFNSPQQTWAPYQNQNSGQGLGSYRGVTPTHQATQNSSTGLPLTHNYGLQPSWAPTSTRQQVSSNSAPSQGSAPAQQIAIPAAIVQRLDSQDQKVNDLNSERLRCIAHNDVLVDKIDTLTSKVDTQALEIEQLQVDVQASRDEFNDRIPVAISNHEADRNIAEDQTLNDRTIAVAVAKAMAKHVAEHQTSMRALEGRVQDLQNMVTSFGEEANLSFIGVESSVDSQGDMLIRINSEIDTLKESIRSLWGEGDESETELQQTGEIGDISDVVMSVPGSVTGYVAMAAGSDVMDNRDSSLGGLIVGVSGSQGLSSSCESRVSKRKSGAGLEETGAHGQGSSGEVNQYKKARKSSGGS